MVDGGRPGSTYITEDHETTEQVRGAVSVGYVVGYDLPLVADSSTSPMRVTIGQVSTVNLPGAQVDTGRIIHRIPTPEPVEPEPTPQVVATGWWRFEGAATGVGGVPVSVNGLTTEAGDQLTTEAGDPITT